MARLSRVVAAAGALIAFAAPATPRQAAFPDPTGVYTRLWEFDLSGGSRRVEDLTLSRDRAEMTFTGTFFFSRPVAGEVRGAVFIGEGRFRAEVPPDGFEQINVARLLDDESVESDFETAVIAFTDDTYQRIGPATEDQSPDGKVRDLAEEFSRRLVKETGVNIPARLAVSILNREDPGFFAAEFDGGTRGRFDLILDYQARIPSAGFGIDGGEKGLIFAREDSIFGSSVWTAFHSLGDYEGGGFRYPDAFDQIDIVHYDMEIDLRDPTDHLGLTAKVDFLSRGEGLVAIPLMVNESLPEADLDDSNLRRNRGMRLVEARLPDGTALEAVQHEWESGLTVFLPQPASVGAAISVILALEGDLITDRAETAQVYYPIRDTAWYPRHSRIDRATYDLEFLHDDDHRVAASGERVSSDPEAASEPGVSRWRVERPITGVSFAVGVFNQHDDDPAANAGEPRMEIYSRYPLELDEDFLLERMRAFSRVFEQIFGAYPLNHLLGLEVPAASWVRIEPSGFFARMLSGGETPDSGRVVGLPGFIWFPNVEEAELSGYLISEAARQWWGHDMLPRSYRDRWLIEGFVAYAALFVGAPQDSRFARDVLEFMRYDLTFPIRQRRGVSGFDPGDVRVAEAGPLTAGRRLRTVASAAADQRMLSNKSPLVFRMLHFLLTDPASGDGTAFFDLIREVYQARANGMLTSADFAALASERFRSSPMATLLGVDDLSWFFREWVDEAWLPSYRIEYGSERRDDGTVLLTGTLYQDDVPDDFLMPIPVRARFDRDRTGVFLLRAAGSRTTFSVVLPEQPDELEIDPDWWILSAENAVQGN